MRVRERFTDPHPEAVRFLASIPLVESHYSPRGSILHVPRNAFIDAPAVPALVMHPMDYQCLQVSAETGKVMSEPSVQFEGLLRYVNGLIEKRAARALRRIDRMHRGPEPSDPEPSA